MLQILTPLHALSQFLFWLLQQQLCCLGVFYPLSNALKFRTYVILQVGESTIFVNVRVIW